MGCIVSKLFWVFIFFIYLQGPLENTATMNFISKQAEVTCYVDCCARAPIDGSVVG